MKSKIFRQLFLIALIIVIINGSLSSESGKKKTYYPITPTDSEYLENIRTEYDSNISETDYFNIVAYKDKNAGTIKMLSNRYLEIQLDVLPIPYIGKFLKGIVSIDEYARFYNVWEDSIHIQEEKRGIFFYRIQSNGKFKLLKYYGEGRRKKRREGRIYSGKDIVSILHSKLNGNKLDHVKTFAFGFRYFGDVNDFGDSISLDPNKFFVIDRKGIIPIIDDDDIPIKDLFVKFDENGKFLEGGGLIKKGFDTHVIIKENTD